MVARDQSDRRRLERERDELAQRALQSQKLEAVGQLAAGMAHDMNNMLTVILACSSDPLPDAAGPLAEALREVHTAGLRGRELTGRLTALFRKQPLRRERFDLGVLLTELETLMRRTLPSHITLKVERPGEPCWFEGDEGAWHQALLNLAINARDAMSTNGTLTMGCRPLDGATEVWVADTGDGMSAQVLERAFEPFFTTKPMGAGTGLGLSHVHSVAQAHGVEPQVVSQVSQGTRISFVLPRPAVKQALVSAAATQQRPHLAARVLLVDDDVLAARATARALRSLGLTVTTADGGDAALAQLRTGFSCDLVMTDLSMPGLDGEGLAAAVARERPDLKVMVYSGEIRDERLARLTALGVRAVLPKPYSMEELGAAVRRGLG